MNYFRNNKQHAVIIMHNRDDCIAVMINQHFGNANVYEKTSKEESQEFIDEVVRIF